MVNEGNFIGYFYAFRNIGTFQERRRKVLMKKKSKSINFYYQKRII